MDLWRIARQGGEPQLLLDCAGERCSQPVWSPDSRRIAYSRQPAAIAPGAPPGAPRPWLLDVQSGQSTPVFDDSQIIGFGASWSPDGKRVAIYDGIAGELQVVELDSGEVVLLSSNTGTTGEWSPDGRYLLYTKVESGETSTHTMVMRADFTSGEIATLIGKGAEGHDAAYSVPDWSPAGDQLVLGLRLDPGSPEKHLWVIQPDYLGGAMIADEPGYTYSFYSWDPWGNAIVMQAFRLGTSEPSEVMLWTAEGGLRSLAKVAMLPDWLP
jgi:dipeptidyl aminopeptidase/acylaminoacyl peptidase